MDEQDQDVDVVVVGAGFAGLYLIHRLRGMGLSVRVFEAGGDVGGTWYWNRYPGARCDVDSIEYSYSFDEDLQQEWNWTERYATQPEILSYLNHVADRFDLRRSITFDARVASAHFDETSARWTVSIESGATARARYVVLATGCLSSANVPDIPGRDTFAGPTFHTGAWPHDGVDFTGMRVGVIGTGSSAIQSIPLIAEQAGHLTVFQRTATYSVPAHNAPLPADEVAEIKARYPEFRAANREQMAAFGSRNERSETLTLSVDEAERQRVFDERWAIGGLAFLGGFADAIIDRDANEIAADYVRGKIREIVDDPAVAELLSPKQVIGCKRLCVDTGYYATYNRPNVTLVDVSSTGITAITPTGIRVGDVDHELDAIVFATGFDAMTGSISKIDIVGRSGLALSEAWEAGPINYLGLSVPGFPNLFTVSGPGSPSVLTNMVVSIEQHVEWITDAIASLDADGVRTIEATPEAAANWVGYVNAVADFTLFPHCNSWYLGANIPGKTRVFMPLLGFPEYVAQCDHVASRGYEGFVLA